MRILLLNHSFHGGGAERCVRDLYHGLNSRGHEVHVWIANPQDNLPDNVKAICRPWESKLRPLDLFANQTDWRHRGSIEQFKQITPDQFDLIHLHHVGGGWLSLKALNNACQRVPSVWTHHDQWAVSNGFICDFNGIVPKEHVTQHAQGLNRLARRSPYHDNFKNRNVGKLIDRLAPRSPLMIAPSQYMLRMIRNCSRFDSSQSTHIYHGLSLLSEPTRHMDRLEARQIWNIDPKRPVVLMVAAHLNDFHKGIHLGLEAINKLQGDSAPHVFLLGKNTDALRQQLPTNHVTTAYAADNATLASAYRAADVTLIPSMGESLSLVALESLACETPLVTFRVTAPAEIVGDNERGLAADPFDVTQLSTHLQRLLDDESLRKTMGTQGNAWVQQQCDMALFLDRIESTYSETVASFGK